TDKTGTLTEGRMNVEFLVTPDQTHAVSGSGYEAAGLVEPAPDAPLARLARDIALCNDAHLDGPDWAVTGDPMEGALLAAAYRCGLTSGERSSYRRTGEMPFDAARHRMTTAQTGGDGRTLVTCKGSPESVLTPDLLADDPGYLSGVAAQAQRLAESGYRVLAVADTLHDTLPAGDDLERGLRYAGLVALADPLRTGAPGVAQSFAGAGIRLLLITGDHPATATAIADRLSLPPGRIVCGSELEREDIDVDGVRVFARTRPEQKLRIVRTLQAQGHVVAMTGDGVNDAPALRRADIGVAMGFGGTEAAREASDLVLADDNLATLTGAVEEGRRIYANVRRFLGYALSGGLAEILVMLAGPFLGFGIPLLPAQILWINMITHGLPGVAMGTEPAERDSMRQQPRPPGEAMLAAGLWRRVALTGGAITVVTLAAAQWALVSGRPWQSVLFTTLGFAQLGTALAVRSRRAAGAPRNPWLPAAVASSVSLQLAALFVPPLHALLGTRSLAAADLTVCVALAAIPGLALVTVRWIASRRSAESLSPAIAGGPPQR
ncbi:MAG: P-type Ca2+ transporter type, partial [Cryptosporangiaceae bacterium]|nr:P-type Ca2+ transporter type [Cryptosporangiaceae bacterium]